MKNLDFNQKHYDQMLINDEDYSALSLEQLQEKVQKGAELVDKNKGFAGIDMKLDESEMTCVGAFIDFRLAKQDLGEYVEEIND